MTPPEQEGQMFDLYDLDKKLSPFVRMRVKAALLNYGLLRGRDV